MQDNTIAGIPALLREQGIASVKRHLLAHPVCEEYDLIQAVVRETDYAWPRDGLLAIFQKHFLVRHCLYSLNRSFQQEHQLAIDITPLRITLHKLTAAREFAIGECNGELENYYLEQRHFHQTNIDDVTQLLAGFWQKFSNLEEKAAALECFQLDNNANWGDIKARYRELAMSHHPDRGGEEEAFGKIHEAYLTLKNIYSR